MRITSRHLGVLAVGALALAACGSDDSSSADEAPAAAATEAPGATEAPEATTESTDDAATATTTHDGDDMDAAMAPPAFASGFQLALTSDAAGTVVTENEVTVNVEATGYELDCGWAGKAVNEEFGHYHILLDGALVDMECENTTTVSMQNVEPGDHTIAVVPALNDHLEVVDNMAMIEFTYEPTAALPEITDAAVTGDPEIRIVSPAAGDVVSGDFEVVVEVDNFELNCDLYGKPGLIGIGHYHMNLDTTDGPMMGMAAMMGMGCTQTFQASTEGLEPGSSHTLIALLADNGHAPLMNADAATVEVTVG